MALSLLEIERRLLNWVTVFSSSWHLTCVYAAHSPRWPSVHACAQEPEEEGDTVKLHVHFWFDLTSVRISGRKDAGKHLKLPSWWRPVHLHFEKDKSCEEKNKTVSQWKEWQEDSMVVNFWRCHYQRIAAKMWHKQALCSDSFWCQMLDLKQKVSLPEGVTELNVDASVAVPPVCTVHFNLHPSIVSPTCCKGTNGKKLLEDKQLSDNNTE